VPLTVLTEAAGVPMELERVATASIHANDYLYVEGRNCECKGVAPRYAMRKP
jgi:hypothetical protein